MTSPINSTSPFTSTSASTASTSASSSSSASSGTPALGEGDFLKLLMAQLENQDPTAPTDGTTFVTQLAQFSQVEQSVNQTTTLGNISTQLQSLTNSNASGLVGKTVTVSTGTVQWGSGSISAPVTGTIAAQAASATATITDSSGNVVRTYNLGASAPGTIGINWDGKDASGTSQPAGSYSVTFSASDANGQPIPVSQTATGVVSSVSYNQGYPALNLGSGVVAPVSQLVSVGTTAPTTP
jgi:flagellar basal-body rod modification protein FlgD